MDPKQIMIGVLVSWIAFLVLATVAPVLLMFLLIADLVMVVLLFIKRKEIAGSQVWLAAAIIVPLIHLEVGCTADAIGNPDRYFESERELMDRWQVLAHTDLASNHTMKTTNAFRMYSGSPSNRPEGRLIISLGTSSTYGEGVGANKAWPAAMSESLKRREYPATVLNAGISGYNLFQLAIYTRDVLVAYKPDMFILYYGANEGITESAKSWYREMKKALETASLATAQQREKAIMYNTTNPGSIRLLDFLHKSFTVRRIIRKMQYFNHFDTPRVDGANPQPPYNPEPPYLDEVLGNFVKNLAERKIPLLLVAEIADNGHFASEPVAKKMAEVAYNVEGVYFVDLSNAFAKESPKDLFLDFVHPNEKGHERIGHLIATYATVVLPSNEEKEQNKSGAKDVEVEAGDTKIGGEDTEVEVVGAEAG